MMNREAREELYDPKRAHKTSWLSFVKAHSNMRTSKGLLDLKAISKLWHAQKGYDPKVIGYGKDTQWNKQLRATAQAKRSTQGQTKLTGGASTSRRLSDFAVYDSYPIRHDDKGNAYMWLQAVGYHYAKPVKDLKIGDTIVFNYGETYKVIGLKPTKGKAIIMITEHKGKQYESKKQPNTLIAVHNKNLPETVRIFDPAPRKSQGQAGIKAWLKKQGIEPDTVDVEGQYDPNISYSENIKNFKDMLKIDAAGHKAPQVPACANVSQLKAEIKDKEIAAGIPELKRDLKDENTKCNCTQIGLYDPAPRTTQPPKSWFNAMYTGIKNRSDVRNPGAIVKNIWAKLTPAKRSVISAQAKKGHKFKYDLPLPDDRATRGTGTLRMVKPFKLAEVQVNLKLSDYLAALKSGLFSKMKRNDGTVALVARCKSQNKNCNIFVDKVT